MCSYNRVNGTYACENAEELIGTLRDAWKFDGMVMSDWGALHSTVKAASAGLDLEMPGAADENNPSPIDQLFGGQYFSTKLKAAVLTAPCPESTLDAMVTHVLTAMFRIGLFDHPPPDPADRQEHERQHPGAPGAVDQDRHRRHRPAQERRARCCPLSTAHVKSIAVIGDAAKNPLTAAGGSATVLPSRPVVTPLAGITARAGAASRSPTRRARWAYQPLPAVPASAFGSGLTATYYASADLTGTPIATETVPNLDFTGNPAAVAGHRLVRPLHRHPHRARRRRLPVLAPGRRHVTVSSTAAGRHLHARSSSPPRTGSST